jgi:hypothetical protein
MNYCTIQQQLQQRSSSSTCSQNQSHSFPLFYQFSISFLSTGPWLKMLAATESAMSGKKGPLVLLDLASGPGEPGLTIAKKMPQV